MTPDKLDTLNNIITKFSTPRAQYVAANNNPGGYIDSYLGKKTNGEEPAFYMDDAYKLRPKDTEHILLTKAALRPLQKWAEDLTWLDSLSLVKVPVEFTTSPYKP